MIHEYERDADVVRYQIYVSSSIYSCGVPCISAEPDASCNIGLVTSVLELDSGHALVEGCVRR